MNHHLEKAGPYVKTIVLAEDDIDDQDFITEALLQINKQLAIHTVSHGNKLLPLLENLTNEQLPQLIILDYNLPELDGADVLRSLQYHNRYASIPKIVWSTSNSPQYKIRCLELGAEFYIVKPSTMSGIEEMARHMLELCQVPA